MHQPTLFGAWVKPKDCAINSSGDKWNRFQTMWCNKHDWIGYGKDECEYQTNENSLESDTVVEKTIEINCASGDVKTARVNSAPSTGPMYQLKWCGQSARHLERDQREFLMDLVYWVDESVVGWKVCGYDEDMD